MALCMSNYQVINQEAFHWPWFALMLTPKLCRAHVDTASSMVFTGRRGNFSGLAYLANYGPIAPGNFLTVDA